MKKTKIQLEHYRAPIMASHYKRDKTYKVQLYFGHCRNFTNKKQVLNYLAESSRFLNDRFAELNYLIGDIFMAYRQNWPFMASQSTTDFLDTQFFAATNQMNKYCNNFGLQQNFNAFSRLYKTIEILTGILNKLEQIEKGRYNAAPAFINSLSGRIQTIKTLTDQFLSA